MVVSRFGGFVCYPQVSVRGSRTHAPLRIPVSRRQDNVSDKNIRDLTAQRDILRQIYLSDNVDEQRVIVDSSLQHIDQETGIHIVCFLADQCSKGQLRGTNVPAVADALLQSIYSRLNLKEMPPRSIGALIWSLEMIPQPEESTDGTAFSWRTLVLQQVSDQENKQERIESYATRELVNIIISTGNLSRSQDVNRSIVRYLISLMGELLKRMDAAPHVRGAFGPSDYADTLTSSARMYATCVALDNKEGMRKIEAFMDRIGQEIRRQLTNRQSMMTAFDCQSIIRILAAFVHINSFGRISVPCMLETIAGFLSSKIRSKQGSNAVKTVKDLAGIMECYAFFGTKTLATVELLDSCGYQFRQICADIAEGRQEPSISDSEWILAVTSILASHKKLGFKPSEATIVAMMPAVWHYIHGSGMQERKALYTVMDSLDIKIGPAMLSYLK